MRYSNNVLLALLSVAALSDIAALSQSRRVFTTTSACRTFVATQGVHVPPSRRQQQQYCERNESGLLFASSNEDTGVELPSFVNAEEYTSYLLAASALPMGFATGSAEGSFVSQEAPVMGPLAIKATVIYLTDGPTDSWAATFTTNKFPGCPIKIGRSRLASGRPIQAIVINNKVSNVCSGGDGVASAELVCEAVAAALNLSDGVHGVLPSSTGVIGWRLPAKELAHQVIPRAIEALQSDTAYSAARDIMTTDRYPKLRTKTMSNGARIVGIAKGAGMIEPNMATMLSYIMTDAAVPKRTLQTLLTEAVDQSFNSISIDGDESTSDTAVIISSNRVSGTDMAEFKDALFDITRGLSADMVRNGEGTSHVMRVRVDNFPGSDHEARRLGRHIVNSPLFKCALAGNDPNVGRLAAAIGSFMGKFKNGESLSTVTLTLGGKKVFTQGKFVLEGDEVERAISQHMKDAQFGEHDDFPSHQRFVEIGVDFGTGTGSATVLGSDLTAEYVAVNADYRS